MQFGEKVRQLRWSYESTYAFIERFVIVGVPEVPVMVCAQFGKACCGYLRTAIDARDEVRTAAFERHGFRRQGSLENGAPLAYAYAPTLQTAA
ncbi:MAG: hypothetical protein PHO10_01415 [Gemmiger sp.]|nr:hypothetical protein [Gemmiger sp.]